MYPYVSLHLMKICILINNQYDVITEWGYDIREKHQGDDASNSMFDLFVNKITLVHLDKMYIVER